MSIRSAVRWARADLNKDFRQLDPSKLMIAPILFCSLMAVADRAIYEVRLQVDPHTPHRPTRL